MSQTPEVLDDPFLRQPLVFTKNVGQWDERVLFRASVRGAQVWIATDGVYYQFFRKVDSPTKTDTSEIERFKLFKNRDALKQAEQLIVKTFFVGSKSKLVAHGLNETNYRCNFLIGDDPTKWRTDVPSYSSIVVPDLYRGIDLIFYSSTDGSLEYDLVVAPGADYQKIQLRYDGVNSLAVDANGDLAVETNWQTFHERQPRIFQNIDGESHAISGGFQVLNGQCMSFYLSDEYDSRRPLTIDPTLVFSTYLGGTWFDYAHAIAVDADGAAYVTGSTLSADFPVLNSQQPLTGPQDVFVTKLSPSGDALVYSTFIGGNGYDEATGIAVDKLGRAYICGETTSYDFPRVNNFLPLGDPYNGFIVRFNEWGNALEFSSYVGGDNGEAYPLGIAVDAASCLYLAGVTSSWDLPLVRPIQSVPGGDVTLDGFVMKLDSAGSELIFSTYFGGNDRDFMIAIDVSVHGRIVVAGGTNSTNFPLKNPIMSASDGHFGEDAFAAQFAANGDSLIYSTILGGTGLDAAYGIAVDEMDCAYVVGRTGSANFPTKNMFLPFYCCGNGFLTKISSNGDSLIYSVQLGGSANDEAFDVAIVEGQAVVAGETLSADFPLKDPYQDICRSQDGFITKFSLLGDHLVYSTFLGGSSYERIHGIDVDPEGGVYVAGYSWSHNFPLVNPLQTAQGYTDAFVAKLTDDFLCGDADASQQVILSDIIYLINFIFAGGYQPNPIVAADVDCNGIVTISDAVYLINYIFSGGAAPCASCS